MLRDITLTRKLLRQVASVCVAQGQPQVRSLVLVLPSADRANYHKPSLQMAPKKAAEADAMPETVRMNHSRPCMEATSGLLAGGARP